MDIYGHILYIANKLIVILHGDIILMYIYIYICLAYNGNIPYGVLKHGLLNNFILTSMIFTGEYLGPCENSTNYTVPLF